MKLTPIAVWRTRASPGPGAGSGTSSKRSSSGPPGWWTTIALGMATRYTASCPACHAQSDRDAMEIRTGAGRRTPPGCGRQVGRDRSPRRSPRQASLGGGASQACCGSTAMRVPRAASFRDRLALLDSLVEPTRTAGTRSPLLGSAPAVALRRQVEISTRNAIAAMRRRPRPGCDGGRASHALRRGQLPSRGRAASRRRRATRSPPRARRGRDEHGVVAGDRAEHLVEARLVERARHRRGGARLGAHDDQRVAAVDAVDQPAHRLERQRAAVAVDQVARAPPPRPRAARRAPPCRATASPATPECRARAGGGAARPGWSRRRAAAPAVGSRGWRRAGLARRRLVRRACQVTSVPTPRSVNSSATTLWGCARRRCARRARRSPARAAPPAP